jgi:surface protein
MIKKLLTLTLFHFTLIASLTAQIVLDVNSNLSTVCHGDTVTIDAVVELDSSNQAFIMKVRTTNPGISGNNQFQLTGAEGEYNVVATNILTNHTDSFFSLVDQQTLTFSEGAGDYLVRIFPNGNTLFHRIQFNNSGDRSKLIDIANWGDIQWTSFSNAFYGCDSMIVSAVDTPNLAMVNNLSGMFRAALSFNQEINHWDLTSINNTSFMFLDAVLFNQELNAWNMASVTNMGLMFYGASAFNKNIGNWEVSSVINMSRMFEGAASLSQDLGSWDVSSVSQMNRMFANATSFNQDLSEWCVSNITSEPIDFSTNSPLTISNSPIWGTCP